MNPSLSPEGEEAAERQQGQSVGRSTGDWKQLPAGTKAQTAKNGRGVL
jgi:hypothetical protein